MAGCGGSTLGAVGADFDSRLADGDNGLVREDLSTIQVNMGYRCNQACSHCHLKAAPDRTEDMDHATLLKLLDFIDAAQPETVDITGGSPELASEFRNLVSELRARGVDVIVRTNLTVLLEDECAGMIDFLAAHRVRLTASMPCYTRENVDAQRGEGVYDKSIEAMKRLNTAGFGVRDGLTLDLVYNPGGAFLPGPQAGLEADYRRELMEREGVTFSHLLTITNMPIGRWSQDLACNGASDKYLRLLVDAFNPETVDGLMCRHEISIAWDGALYDCDFNQALGRLAFGSGSLKLGDVPAAELVAKLIGARITTDEHCFGCTAGAGSSCRGALV